MTRIQCVQEPFVCLETVPSIPLHLSPQHVRTHETEARIMGGIEQAVIAQRVNADPQTAPEPF